MAWTLHYQPIRNPRADDALLALGRALYICTAFEDKCRFVLRIIYLIEAHEADAVLQLEQVVSQLPKDKTLDATLRQLEQKLPATQRQVGLLTAARLARNFIAHEGARFGIHSEALAPLRKQMEQLRVAVRDLAAGDNLMSLWTFEITDWKEPTPSALMAAYDSVVERWVFDPVWDLLTHGTHETKVAGDGRWHG